MGERPGGLEDRGRAGSLTFAVLLLLLAPTDARAWTAGSGDVDLDGRTTTRDAVLILESASWPPAERVRLRGWLDACDVNRDTVCDTSDAYAIFLTAITDWNDFDADGVPNAVDCAVFDERIATPHTYYGDRDLDHLGATDQAVALCTVTPPPPLVPWDGDPDDYSPERVRAVPTRGARLLGIDPGDPAEAGTWRGDLLHELGVDAGVLQIDWAAIETSPGVYAGPQLTVIQRMAAAYAELGVRAVVAVNPIAHGYLSLPADLRVEVESGRLRLSDERVITRFNAMLAFVRHATAPLVPVSVQLGYEVDRFLARSDVPIWFWADYGELVLAGSQHAKALWGQDLKVGVTATHAGLLSPASRAQLAAINSLVDMVSATYVSPGAGFAGVEPASIRVELQRLVALAYPRTLHLQAVEYPSAPSAGGSETRQSQFVRAVFDVWDDYRELIPYISFGRLHDRAPIGITAGSGSTQLAAGAQGSAGLRTWERDGRAKTAYNTLRNLAFERGWWRMPAPSHRSFEMGFTPALFDAPADAVGYVGMLDWIADAARREGTFYNLHLDAGVPWLEAAADDFTGSDPPYSAYLRASWSAQRARIPAGQTLMVSVNPSGVPRNVLAPYFGVGEGFIYNDQFERVGDGIVADYENRLPPWPWGTYRFDDPAVKQAFTSYCRRVLQYFAPRYLIVAIETTATMHESPEAHDALVALVAHVRADLKSRPETRNVTLLVSLSATSFMTDEYGIPLKREEHAALKLDRQLQGVLDLAPQVDGFALSFYPHYSKWNSTFMLASMFGGLWDVLARVGKPTGFSETGWPAESFDVLGSPFFSDQEKQARFVRLLIAEAERAPVPVEFIVNFRTRDGDLQWQRLLAWSKETPPKVSPQFVEFYKYFRDIGLFDGEGRDRPATLVWREHLARPFRSRTAP